MDFSICCIKECDAPAIALGLCINHWRRNRKYGSPVAQQRHVGMFIGRPAFERWLMLVAKSEGCWIWKGGTDKDGYGAFKGEAAGQMHQRAHRFSWSHANDAPIPRYMHVCHTCDTPRCVKPEHLFLGSALQNMRDKIEKGRARYSCGEESPHAKMTEREVKAIRADPRPYAEIGAQYGVSASTVGDIKSRKSWAKSNGDVVKSRRVNMGRRGVSDKLDASKVRAIRGSAEPLKVMAQRYGVSIATICDIRKRRSWAHVE
jgi:hypothetical protein